MSWAELGFQCAGPHGQTFKGNDAVGRRTKPIEASRTFHALKKNSNGPWVDRFYLSKSPSMASCSAIPFQPTWKQIRFGCSSQSFAPPSYINRSSHSTYCGMEMAPGNKGTVARANASALCPVNSIAAVTHPPTCALWPSLRFDVFVPLTRIVFNSRHNV